jgi:hypothetical protein
VALFLAAGLNTKFSGVLLVPITAALLATRVILPRPWDVLNKPLSNWRSRAVAALALLVVCGAVSIIAIWACYGFRFRPTPHAEVRLNMPLVLQSVLWTEQVARDPQHRVVPLERLTNRTPPLAAQIMMWANDHELLPQAWIAGFLDSYKTTMLGSSFLLGQINRTGARFYFPLTMLFKTPSATIAAGLVVLGLWIALLRRRWRATGAPPPLDAWTALCLLLPVGIYIASAIASSINLGLRHILAIYPLLFVFLAACLAWLWRRSTTAKVVVCLLGAVLAGESLRTYPNYIPFFNTPSGGWRGGIRLLGDSNLDWGQDLSLLAQWHREHPQTRLYVSYFGMADPGYYLDSYISAPANSGTLLSPQYPREKGGVLAVNATNLQGIYLDVRTRAMFRRLLENHQPVEVLGGTIYLYEVTDALLRDFHP